jgi:alpha-D-xyloside xylohydrolase
MKGFLQDGNALLWERNHEKMRIEPWGSDSLRVRASMGTDIQMDLPGGLVDPVPIGAQIEIDEGRATIRNGSITAEAGRRSHASGQGQLLRGLEIPSAGSETRYQPAGQFVEDHALQAQRASGYMG